MKIKYRSSNTDEFVDKERYYAECGVGRVDEVMRNSCNYIKSVK
jgi:hypothetical protein